MILELFLVVGIVLVGLVGIVLAYAATRPDTFRVVRQASIPAPPENVLALLTDFHRWES